MAGFLTYGLALKYFRAVPVTVAGTVMAFHHIPFYPLRAPFMVCVYSIEGHSATDKSKT